VSPWPRYGTPDNTKSRSAYRCVVTVGSRAIEAVGLRVRASIQPWNYESGAYADLCSAGMEARTCERDCGWARGWPVASRRQRRRCLSAVRHAGAAAFVCGAKIRLTKAGPIKQTQRATLHTLTLQDLDADSRNVLECARALQRAAGSAVVAPEHVREALEAVGKVKGGGGGGGNGGGGGDNLTREELEETMKKMLAVSRLYVAAAGACGMQRRSVISYSCHTTPTSNHPRPLLTLHQPSPDPLLSPLSNQTNHQPPGGLGEGESALDRFTRDVTAEARRGRLDPLIGRDAELRRVTHILLRRTKNNPVLVGESGVGKTAIAEGLAQRIVAGDVPPGLMGFSLLELDLPSLVRLTD